MSLSELNALVLREGELQQALLHEREQVEIAKNAIQQLKEELSASHTENRSLQHRIEELLQERLNEKTQTDALVGQLKHRNTELQDAFTALRHDCVTTERTDQLLSTTRHEIQVQYNAKLSDLRKECSEWQRNYQQLRQEQEFLKTEYDSEMNKFQRMVAEMRRQSDAEVLALRKEKELLSAQMLTGTSDENRKQRNAFVEKQQLERKVLALNTELDEMSARLGKSEAAAHSNLRNSQKRIHELELSVSSLRTDNESLKNQQSQARNEMNDLINKNMHSEGECLSKEKIILSLNSQLDELQHKFKLEVSGNKAALSEQITRLEGRLSELTSEKEAADSQIESLRLMIEKKDKQYASKCAEMVQAVQEAKRNRFKELNDLEHEKIELNAKIVELQGLLRNQNSSADANQLMEVRHEKSLLEKDLAALRSECVAQRSRADSLEVEHSDCSRKLADLRNEYDSFKLECVRDHQPGNKVQELQAAIAELNRRIAQANQLKEKSDQKAASYKDQAQQLKAKYASKIDALRTKLLEYETGGQWRGEGSGGSDQMAQLRRVLKELQRRHNQFGNLMNAPLPVPTHSDDGAADHLQQLQQAKERLQMLERQNPEYLRSEERIVSETVDTSS